MNPWFFLLRVIGAMVPVFSIWWFIGSSWLQPAVVLTDYLLSSWFPHTFFELRFLGDTVAVLTQWDKANGNFVPSSMTGSHLGFEVNLRILSYSFPFFFSLQMALWQACSAVKIGFSLITLYLVLIISLAFIIGKQMMINIALEPVFVETTLYWYANPEFIILGFQAATLMLPTLTPVLLWVAVNQKRLKSFIIN